MGQVPVTGSFKWIAEFKTKQVSIQSFRNIEDCIKIKLRNMRKVFLIKQEDEDRRAE